MANDPLWIEHAHLDKGSFSAKAKKAGKSTASYASAKAGSGGKLGHQARLAKTLMGLHKGHSQASALRS
jgi:hypothetical protein